MNLQTMQERVAARVREIPALAGLPVFEEHKGNIVEKVNQSIAETSFCVVVAAAGFSDEAPDSSTCYGTAAITVTVFEDPFVNRDIIGRPTFTAAAQEIAKALKLFDTGDGHLTSPTISDPDDLGNGTVAVDIRLSVKTTL